MAVDVAATLDTGRARRVAAAEGLRDWAKTHAKLGIAGIMGSLVGAAVELAKSPRVQLGKDLFLSAIGDTWEDPKAAAAYATQAVADAAPLVGDAERVTLPPSEALLVAVRRLVSCAVEGGAAPGALALRAAELAAALEAYDRGERTELVGYCSECGTQGPLVRRDAVCAFGCLHGGL
jgi:hypothetical protein